MTRDETLHIEDWSPVPPDRFEMAQQGERDFWTRRDPEILSLSAKYYYFAGFHRWTVARALMNPFRIDAAQPGNYQLAPDDVEGTDFLDIGPGPATMAMSLVHCANVTVIDPLLGFFRSIQPWGWDHFAAAIEGRAEQMPFQDASFDFVLCQNVLDHVADADSVLREIARVLRADGQLLFGCDVRGEHDSQGGPAHPYRWTIDALESRLLDVFEPVIPIVLMDQSRNAISRDHLDGALPQWVGRLRRRSDAMR